MNFAMSGYEQLVRGPTHIAFNRFHLLVTDVPDIVDVVVGTPLGTSDFVSKKYCLFKASYQLGHCPQCSQELHMAHHVEVS